MFSAPDNKAGYNRRSDQCDMTLPGVMLRSAGTMMGPDLYHSFLITRIVGRKPSAKGLLYIDNEQS